MKHRKNERLIAANAIGLSENECTALAAVAQCHGEELDAIVDAWTQESLTVGGPPDVKVSLQEGLASCLGRGFIEVLDREKGRLYRENWLHNRDRVEDMWCEYKAKSICFTLLGEMSWFYIKTYFAQHGLGVSYYVETLESDAASGHEIILLYLREKEELEFALKEQWRPPYQGITITKGPYSIGRLWITPQIVWHDAWLVELENSPGKDAQV